MAVDKLYNWTTCADEVYRSWAQEIDRIIIFKEQQFGDQENVCRNFIDQICLTLRLET